MKRSRFGLGMLRRLHAVLLDSVRGRDKTPGEFRRTRVWIGATGTPIEAARFIPPLPARLPGLLANLEKYWRGASSRSTSG